MEKTGRWKNLATQSTPAFNTMKGRTTALDITNFFGRKGE